LGLFRFFGQRERGVFNWVVQGFENNRGAAADAATTPTRVIKALDPHARVALRFPALSVRRKGLLGGSLIRPAPATGPLVDPRGDAAAGNPKSNAELGDGVVGLHLLNTLENTLEAPELGSERVQSVFLERPSR
jgi:hypothetical protein